MQEEESCDLKVLVNDQQAFFLNQKMLSTFSAKLRTMIQEESGRSGRAPTKYLELKIPDFPGGPDGFELAAMFCYNDGSIPLNPSNACVLHCAAAYLGITDLLRETEAFLGGVFHWTWNEILDSLRSCESFFPSAESSGLLHNLVSSLLAKISANSEGPLMATPPLASPPSSNSSPDTSGLRPSSSANRTPETIRPSFSREWWFDDLTVLHPTTIEKIIRALGAYGADNRNLIVTRFLLHYLKTAIRRPGGGGSEYGGLADTAVHGVVLMGRTAFSCRGLFWVLRVVTSGLGLSQDCRRKLERLMGLMLDQATLDDLLVSGQGDGTVYDVGLVATLVGVFVSDERGVSAQRLKKVGRLMDKYLREVAPDQSLKVPMFLGLAENLPDSARDCFDGVYRALDIYLESHPTLSPEDKSRLCRCLNYEKLTLEACKDLAKNPRIPPRATVQALASQQSRINPRMAMVAVDAPAASSPYDHHEEAGTLNAGRMEPHDEKEELRLNLQRMQWRVVELEKVCREMKGQMSKMVRSKPVGSASPHHHNASRGLPRLC